MHYPVKDMIRKRRSVRTYNGKALRPADRQKLEVYLENVTNPYNIPVTFRFLPGKENGLSCPVTVGVDLYVGAKLAISPHMEEAVGYSFEKFVLYAESLGLGTVILGGTMNRPAFEKAMELQEQEVMPLATPIGYPAEKMSIRETIMRKGIKADERMAFETLFFDGTFDRPLTREGAGELAEALEMVRLAPSAVNRQPWRVLVQGDRVHFYEKPSKGMGGGAWDIQKVDLGIAMAHFALTLEEQGRTVRLCLEKPELEEKTGELVYIGSFVVA